MEAKCVTDKSVGMLLTVNPSHLNIHCAATTSQLAKRTVGQALATMVSVRIYTTKQQYLAWHHKPD